MKENKYSYWITGEGPENDIVLSSRIRLARNIERLPYPNQADGEVLNQVLGLVKDTISGKDAYDLNYLNLNNTPELERKTLVERHLISPALAEGKESRGVFLNNKEDISLMVNEEDHIRIQVILPGMQLDSAWKRADEIDDFMEEELDFAFSSKWGYLSACPTNMGTGLRASVMVHLPALNLTNNIEKMLGAVSQLGLAVRGLYGEGSESAGNIYQISNQITLGHSEKDILENLNSVTMQIIEQERQARKRLLQNQEVEVKDRIKRSYGTLKYAYKMTNKEALELLSNVRLGIDMDILKEIESGLLSELLVLIRPAHLQKIENQQLSPTERDIKRASLIQKILSDKIN